MFCHLIHYTGCRPSEALELTPNRIFLEPCEVVLRTLKKRRTDDQGREKLPQFRTVPVPVGVIDQLDLVFNLKRRQRTGRGLDEPLWSMSRSTA